MSAPVNTSGGWTCQTCGAFVAYNAMHVCGGRLNIDFGQAAPRGWECPRCRIIHAPWVTQCYCPRPAIEEPRDR